MRLSFRAPLLLASLLVGSAAFAACGDGDAANTDESTGGGRDGGADSARDATSTQSDAGGADSATTTDASVVDAGADAGTDAGTTVDAGSGDETDAGTPCTPSGISPQLRAVPGGPYQNCQGGVIPRTDVQLDTQPWSGCCGELVRICAVTGFSTQNALYCR